MELIFEISQPCTPEDYDYLKKFIKDYLNRDRTPVPKSGESIIQTIYDYFDEGSGLDYKLITTLKERTRLRQLLIPRQVCRYFLRRKTKWSLAKIGVETGMVDHATTLSSCRVIANLIATDKDFARQIDEIEILLTKT